MDQADEPTLFPPTPDRIASATMTVSQVTALVKRVISDGVPSPIHIVGEVSNFTRHKSGHVYFTLKDSTSELSCVMWRATAQRLKFDPQNGLEVVATGEIDVYARTSRYQLYARKLEPRGVGALELAFRQLHQKLEAEGLFQAAGKQNIPACPSHVAVITSPTGAAVRDILQTIRRRFPCVTVSVYPVTVQGDQAAGEIVAALDRLNACNDRLRIDVIIAGRGGGSLEDLWAFNEESVARAIHRSRIPIISAVGHETDVTISDLVADLRAATPTAAAVLAVPVRSELLEDLQQYSLRLSRTIQHRLTLNRHRLTSLVERELFRRPLHLVRQQAEVLDQTRLRLDHAVQGLLHGRMQVLSRLQNSLAIIEPSHFVADLRDRMRTRLHRLRMAMQRRMQSCERQVYETENRLVRISPEKTLRLAVQRLQSAGARLHSGTVVLFERCRRQLDSLEKQLQSVSYRRTLARGYSVTRSTETGKLVASAAEVGPGDVVETEVADGRFESTVKGARKEQLKLF